MEIYMSKMGNNLNIDQLLGNLNKNDERFFKTL